MHTIMGKKCGTGENMQTYKARHDQHKPKLNPIPYTTASVDFHLHIVPVIKLGVSSHSTSDYRQVKLRLIAGS